MRLSGSGSVWAIAIAALGVSCLGVWAMYNEGAPYANVGATSLTRLASLPAEDALVGMTVKTQETALLDCEVGLRSFNSVEILYLSEDFRKGLAPKCLAIADGILHDAPTNAFAALVGAAAAAHLEDWDGFNQRLQQSQITAAHEGWVALMRFNLAEVNYARLSPATKAGQDRDAALLVSSFDGLSGVATQYILDEGFRSRMASLLETFSPRDQKRFLDRVRHLIAEGEV